MPGTAGAHDIHTIDPAVYARRWGILAVMCLSLVLVVASVSSLNVAIPTLGRELEATDTQVLWIVDAYAIVFAGLLLPAGALGDRFGRKGALQIGLAVFALASSACALVSSANALIACRAVMGLGAALIMPSTLSMLASVFPPQERQKAIAIWAGFAGAGGAIGPVMAGILLEHFWWGSVFLVAVPIALTAFVLVSVLAPPSRDERPSRLDPVGAALSVAGFSALLFGIIEGPEQGWTAPATLAAFSIAVLGLGSFVMHERRTPYPMLDMRFLERPHFSMGSFGVTFIFMVMFSMFFALTQYLQFVRGYSPLAAAVRVLPFAATMILVSPRSPAIGARIGTKRMVISGMSAMTVGFLVLSFAGESTPYWTIALALVVTACGPALSMPTLSSGILRSVPMQKAGVGSAVNDTTREVGGAIGIAVIGTVISAVYRTAMTDRLADAPEEIADSASDSPGRAFGVAQRLVAEGSVEQGERLLDAVQSAFAEAFRTGLRVSVGIALFATLVMAARFPSDEPTPTGR